VVTVTPGGIAGMGAVPDEVRDIQMPL